MPTEQATTNLERQIRSQPDALEHMLSSSTTHEQVHAAVQGLHRARRIWLVGTGTSQHAAALGAGMIQEAGRSAHAVSSMQFVHWAPIVAPQDAVIIITHTAETPYALSAHALAFEAGMDTVMITRHGSGLSGAVETVEKETSETYTVSYTTAVLALAMIAHEMGAERFSTEALAQLPAAVAAAIEDPGIETVATPKRLLVFAGAGPASTTAREAALKVRESARFLAEGFDVEYLLHGSAVPLTGDDRIVSLFPPDSDGFVEAMTVAAEKAGVPVSRIAEPAELPSVLAQIPLTVRLQLLALRIATEGGQDPDRVITGPWADEALWSMGAPATDRPPSS
jgi:glucosamine--fructose-6-phosphate aminotransferase (isomerizing)